MGKMVTCARCKGKGTIRESGLLGPGKEKKCPVGSMHCFAQNFF